MALSRTEAELEDVLSQPSPEIGKTLAGLDGDLVLLGAGGKVGPTMARMARTALDEAGSTRQVYAVSRWSDERSRTLLEEHGVCTVAADLADPEAYAALPDAAGLWYLAGQKFGTTGQEHRTWWMNAVVPGHAAYRYRGVPTVVYSSGNVYPFSSAHSGGCDESVEPAPIGTYAQSCLAREQAFAYAAHTWQTPVVQFRLNYAVELRYGVLADLATKVLAGEPVDVTMGAFNCVWQRDSTEWSLRAIELAGTPPVVLNATGPETVSTRRTALTLGRLLDRDVKIVGQEAEHVLLSDASACHERYGYPTTGLQQAIAQVAEWVGSGGRQLGKATKFQQRDGRF